MGHQIEDGSLLYLLRQGGKQGSIVDASLHHTHGRKKKVERNKGMLVVCCKDIL